MPTLGTPASNEHQRGRRAAFDGIVDPVVNCHFWRFKAHCRGRVFRTSSYGETAIT